VRSLVHARILENLKYVTMKTRYENVREPYPRTFDWLFDDFAAPALTSLEATPERPWNSFVGWLRHGSGIYWVNGKAASGKSTLMRYIYDSKNTRKYLQEWTKDVPLCPATFFFWNSGNAEQKSQSGLLRALLYQVLNNHPQLTPLVFPSLWARIYSQTVRCLDVEEEVWSIPKLMRAFDALTKQTVVALNLFFLIDGLDEFEANTYDHDEMNYEEICTFFKGIGSFPNIKVCLSSRPWVVFEDSFYDSPSLRLQDLTRGDILHYTYSNFQSSNSFRRLARGNPEAAENLISEVVSKSNGVFLWVRVVVRDLLNGLMNYDGLQDLERRLNKLPRDLEELYDHMLKRTDASLQLPASEIFQVYWTCQHHRDKIGPLDTVDPLTSLALYLAINGKKLGPEGVMSLQEHDLLLRCKETEMQMTARCAGLLELSERTNSSTWSMMNNPIQYMHRTARDFIERDDIWKRLLSRTVETDFNPHEALMKSSILQLSLIPNDFLKTDHGPQIRDPEAQVTEDKRRVEHTAKNEYIRWVDRTATSAMIYAHFSHLQTNKSDAVWLDRLDKIMTKSYQFQRSAKHHWSNQDLARLVLRPMINPVFSMRIAPFPDFLSYAVQFGLTEYVDEKLRQIGRKKGPYQGISLLQYAVRCPPEILRYPHSSKMVSLLLRYGEDPNETYGGCSPWEEVLKSVQRGDILANTRDDGNRREQQQEFLKVIESLIEAGANPNAYIKDDDGSHSALSILWWVKRSFPEAGRFEEDLKCRGAKETVSRRQRLKKWVASVDRTVERNTHA
jgi:hypothetical protein